MTTSLETQAVQDHFADICDSIVTQSDVSTFAGKLLQVHLISVASHRTAVVATGLPPDTKVSNLVDEVMIRVAGSRDKFVKFVSILKSWNEELSAKILRSAYPELASSSETETDPSPAPKLLKEQDSLADQYVAQLKQVYRAPPPTWDPLPQCKHIRLAMVKEKGESNTLALMKRLLLVE